MLGLVVAIAFGQALIGPVPGVQLLDEGSSQGQVTKLNCVGSTVSCAKSGALGTITVTAGGGAGNFVETSVTFDSSGNGIGATVVTGQAWVTAGSNIICSVFNKGTVSNNTTEVYQMAAIGSVVSARVVGTGFTISAYSPNGASGQFFFHCTGA